MVEIQFPDSPINPAGNTHGVLSDPVAAVEGRGDPAARLGDAAPREGVGRAVEVHVGVPVGVASRATAGELKLGWCYGYTYN